MTKTLGDALRDRRKTLGLTQHQVGASMGWPQTYITKWETGTIPERDKWSQLAEFLDLPIEEFQHLARNSAYARLEAKLDPGGGEVARLREDVDRLTRQVEELTAALAAGRRARTPKRPAS